MTTNYEDYVIRHDDVLDGEEMAIDRLYFSLKQLYGSETVRFHAEVEASLDADDAFNTANYPIFDCDLTVRQFKSLAKMFLRFDELVSPGTMSTANCRERVKNLEEAIVTVLDGEFGDDVEAIREVLEAAYQK